MEQETVALQLEALGSVIRLKIYLVLVNAGQKGLNVSQINEKLVLPASTLSHHLAKLIHSDLVTRERQGRNLIYRVNAGVMDSLVMYMANNCCGNDSEVWA